MIVDIADMAIWGHRIHRASACRQAAAVHCGPSTSTSSILLWRLKSNHSPKTIQQNTICFYEPSMFNPNPNVFTSSITKSQHHPVVMNGYILAVNFPSTNQLSHLSFISRCQYSFPLTSLLSLHIPYLLLYLHLPSLLQNRMFTTY